MCSIPMWGGSRGGGGQVYKMDKMLAFPESAAYWRTQKEMNHTVQLEYSGQMCSYREIHGSLRGASRETYCMSDSMGGSSAVVTFSV